MKDNSDDDQDSIDLSTVPDELTKEELKEIQREANLEAGLDEKGEFLKNPSN
jgi:hypothetical protein